ncbi:unnamed protein product [Linum tenue]|uniref:Uncharacterized protein n=1 Tax=Linum tenue TaxID=586396 RepID=A0AAV0JPI5_9ROSI|nr:unnamed protein product [Linum tenue]
MSTRRGAMEEQRNMWFATTQACQCSGICFILPRMAGKLFIKLSNLLFMR